MIYRIMVQKQKIKEITQGSIFNFARCDELSIGTLGLLISARCDLAQNKKEKFIYIPLIPANEWIKNNLIPKQLEEQRSSIIAELKNILKNNSLSESSIDTFGPTISWNLIKETKASTKYKERLADLENIEKIIKEKIPAAKTIINRKALDKKIEDVINNKIEGYFFIDDVVDFQEGGKSLGPHVAILGEPRSIHSSVISSIAEGLIHECIPQHSKNYDSIVRTEGEISYVLCNIKSPYIELIMQRFTSLYSRIGVENPNSDLKQQLSEEILI